MKFLKSLARSAKFFSTLATGGLATALTDTMGFDPTMAAAVVTIVAGVTLWITPNAKPVA